VALARVGQPGLARAVTIPALLLLGTGPDR